MNDLQPATEGSSSTDFDVIIIGAGISGIDTAYYLQTQVPGTSYAILEGRSGIGGTWDLFKYPGIRSDSDMTTFGFAWYSWIRPERLGTAAQIKSYLQNSVERFGIDKHIRLNHRVLFADWDTALKFWSLTVRNDQGTVRTYRARFLVLGTGYYDYEHPRETIIPGLKNFTGQIVHPQFWPADLDYSGKDIVVVGSGATAVTLIPSIAEKAKSVTMLQRSPTYIIPQPILGSEGRLVKFVKRVFPESIASWFKRAHHIFWSTFFYTYCMFFPERIKRRLKEVTMKRLPAGLAWDPHFNPRYNPWEQRLCVCPGGDFYEALCNGKANVVTDTIDTVTQTEIHLASGATLRPDMIVTATGLKLQFGGGLKLSIDGDEIDVSKKYTWKGAMIQDVPNLMFVMGYANTSWTLGADVTAKLLTRLLNLMKRRGAEVAVPRLDSRTKLQEKPVFSLSSTYVQNASEVFPRAGGGNWDHKRNYLFDMFDASWGNISKDLILE
ncbi:FAD/NAD(P)-binding domain-containing protein [Hypomontagnella submonticulosa]|nr:FAD/NAD(P)-binding domain-containing protein [Hypomontagnella submonticulosa]